MFLINDLEVLYRTCNITSLEIFVLFYPNLISRITLLGELIAVMF